MEDLLAWFARDARDLPWRRTRDPYAIWVSEIMLQQTQVNTVVPYWKRWMRALPTIAALARAKPEKIHKLWEGLGYYTRVRHLQKAAQIVVREHGGRLPEKFADVLALPGIGRYTAGAICSIAFNQPRPVLDGNVIRVLTRLYGIAGDPRARETKDRLWQLAEGLVQQVADLQYAPRQTHSALFATDHGLRTTDHGPCACSHLNQSLMELGAVICTPRQPRCGTCPVAGLCAAYRQGRVGELPALGRRTRSTPRRFVAFVVRKGARFLVRQRPAGVVNAHLWEFPNIEIGIEVRSFREPARKVLGSTPAVLEPLCTLKHSITRYRVTLEVFRVTGSKVSRAAPGRWCTSHKLRQLPLTGAHKKILQRLRAV